MVAVSGIGLALGVCSFPGKDVDFGQGRMFFIESSQSCNPV